MSESSTSTGFDRSATPRPTPRKNTTRFAVATTTTTTTGEVPKSKLSGNNPLRFNLGGLPYTVTECEESNKLGWHSAHIDITGFGVLPTLKLEERQETSYVGRGGIDARAMAVEAMIRRKMMDEISIEFAERTQLVVGSSIGGRGFTFGKSESVGTRIEKGSDPIAEGLVMIVFGWPGLPLIQARPIPQLNSNSHLTRSQLASLISSLVTSYFSWVLSLDYTQGIIPYIPWEYDAAPHAFLERYIRCLRLVKLGDGDFWTPVLGGRGLRIKEGRWDIPRCAECEKGECNKAYEHP